MDGFKKRTQQKMETIEQHTINLLSLPINEIKIADIAKLANVSQVSIYNYYESKENLLKSALKKYFEDQIEQFEKTVDSKVAFDEKLKLILIQKKENAKNIHPSTLYALMHSDHKLSEYITSLSNEKSIPLFFKLIEEGKQLNKIRETINPNALLVYLNLLSHSLESLTEESLAMMQEETILDDILNLFFYGILK
jgi:AcrR family transcriptional regulator